MSTQEIKPKDPFLGQLIGEFELKGISIESISRNVSSDDLISLIDNNVLFPSPTHYRMIEAVWFREYAWYLAEEEVELGNEAGSVNALYVVTEWIDSEQQIVHHKEYAERYIIGRIISRENVKWVYGFLKNLAKNLGDTKDLLFSPIPESP